MSTTYKKMEKIKIVIRTTIVVPYTSFRLGQVTFFVSALTSNIKLLILFSTNPPLFYFSMSNLAHIKEIKERGLLFLLHTLFVFPSFIYK